MLEPWQLVAAGGLAFLIGISKTGLTGLGALVAALFAGLLPARASVGIVLLVLIAADVIAVTVYRRDADWPQLIRLFPWAALGVIIGAIAAGQLPDGLMRQIIGGIVVVLVIFQVIRNRTLSAESQLPGWARPVAGLVAGITTMIANAAGPMMSIYLMAMRLPKITFLGTTAWFFLILNLFKVPFSYQLGLITWSSVGLSAQLAPFAMLGALFGKRLVTRIDQRLFERIVWWLTLLAGLRLLLS